MRQYTRLLDVLDRVESGQLVEESNWDMRIVPNEVARLLAEYQIEIGPAGEAIVDGR